MGVRTTNTFSETRQNERTQRRIGFGVFFLCVCVCLFRPPFPPSFSCCSHSLTRSRFEKEVGGGRVGERKEGGFLFRICLALLCFLFLSNETKKKCFVRFFFIFLFDSQRIDSLNFVFPMIYLRPFFQFSFSLFFFYSICVRSASAAPLFCVFPPEFGKKLKWFLPLRPSVPCFRPLLRAFFFLLFSTILGPSFPYNLQFRLLPSFKNQEWMCQIRSKFPLQSIFFPEFGICPSFSGNLEFS